MTDTKANEKKVNQRGPTQDEIVASISKLSTDIKEKTRGNRYPDEFKNLVVVCHKTMKFSIRKIAELFKMSPTSVQRWIHEDYWDEGNEMIEKAVGQLKNRARYKMMDLTNMILDGVTPEKVEKADLKSLLISSKVAADGAILIENNGVQKVLQINELYDIASANRDDRYELEAELEEKEKLLKSAN